MVRYQYRCRNYVNSKPIYPRITHIFLTYLASPLQDQGISALRIEGHTARRYNARLKFPRNQDLNRNALGGASQAPMHFILCDSCCT